ncbi:MAG: hypothetical protein KF712_18415 [Akkermansiaceae bacterium]|nr:hypothetical protein [Akkermansiaceae bacterium]
MKWYLEHMDFHLPWIIGLLFVVFVPTVPFPWSAAIICLPPQLLILTKALVDYRPHGKPYVAHILVNESLLLVPILLNWLIHLLGFRTLLEWKQVTLFSTACGRPFS